MARGTQAESPLLGEGSKLPPTLTEMLINKYTLAAAALLTIAIIVISNR